MSIPTEDESARRPPDEPAPARANDAVETTDRLDEALAALADDFAVRVRRGERVTVEAYAAKHPGLAERIRRVFPAIAAIEGAGATDPTVAAAAENPGSTIGRYKLLERIGEGGFGVVYMAEQHHPVRRRVALKVVKPGMDSRQVLARFEAERQALAIMDHPNIAKVFDGGMTDAGRPYFVMELVRGEPITEFCDRSQLTPRQRLELFAQVCHAVQHAHQKGVIHRDLKPSNVLVAVHDTTPAVKVIDFGVAKALGQELTDRTLFTGFAQVVGTPLYMSPEQAGHSSLDVDTRSDVYSLGVLLYELLTGTTPFTRERFQKAAYDEIRRIIREEEPPRPSTRLSESKDRLPSISAQRHTEPAKLTRLMRGELDWIVMKALEKERARRYESASGFAADVQRYLADEQVLACPPSAAYRFRKFARRNKPGLAVAALVLIFLVLLGGGTGWAVRDREARQARAGGQIGLILAEADQLEREQKWPEALAAVRRAGAIVAGGEADARTAERVRDRLKGLAFIDRLERARMAAATWVGKYSDSAAADREYARAFREYGVDVDELPVETTVERLKARPALVIPVAAALDDWAQARWEVQGGKRDDSAAKRLVAIARGIDPEPLRDRMRATWRRPHAEVVDDLRQVAESIDVRAEHPATLLILHRKLLRVKQPDHAVRLLWEAQRAHPGDFWINFHLAHLLSEQKDDEGAVRFYTAAVAARPTATAALNNLGNVLRAQGKIDEAVAVYRLALEVDPNFVPAHNNLGIALHAQKKLDEAIRHYRLALEVDPNFVPAHNNLGALLCDDLKEYDKAIACFRKAIELNPRDAIAYESLGIALGNQRKADEAIAAYRSAVEIDPGFARAHGRLGNALLHQKKLGEAVPAFRKAIELDPNAAGTYYNLALSFNGLKQHDKAVECFRKALQLEPGNPGVHVDLGNALRAQKKFPEAGGAFREAIKLDPKNASAYYSLGALLCEDLKDYDKAAECFRKAIELDPKFATAHFGLGNALLAQGRAGEAVAAYRKAIEVDPTFVGAYRNLGLALMRQKKIGEAVAAYRKAIELDPADAALHNNLGALSCDYLKEYDKAIACFRKAIELDPKFPDPHNNLAWLLVTCPEAKLRDPTLAVALAKKGIELTPAADVKGQSHGWQVLGWALYRAGDWKGSIAALERSMALQPSPKGGDSGQWFALAMARRQLGDKDEARRWYDRAVEWMDKNDPESEVMRRVRGEAAELLGVNPSHQGYTSTAPAATNPQPPKE